MSTFDAGAFAAALVQASIDIKTNAPLPPSAPMTFADDAAALEALRPKIVALNAWVKAHPGVVRAIDGILREASRQGAPWATDLDAAVNAGPGVLDAGAGGLSTIIGLLTAFSPAPNPLPGMGPRIGRG